MLEPSTIDPETRDLLALHLVPGLGPRLTKALLERFGAASRAVQASAEELRSVPHIGERLAQVIAAAMRQSNIDKELELLAKHEVELMRLGIPPYPETLASLPDVPQLLYMRGTLEPADKNAVAVVGSRHCTTYGRRIAERLAGDLARAGFTVISGLARGIDGAAHRGALAAGGRTIAVLAGGLASIYPPEHADLADEISVHGALLSEAPMSLAPMAAMFPARNRLISGLSRGVVVVEAAEKSGALITARHAAEQGREVFAVPGPVDSPASGGTLRLLKDGATLVRNFQDILDAFGEPTAGPRVTEKTSLPQPAANVPMNENEQKIWSGFASEPVFAEDLVERSGLPVSEVGNTLLMMEMRGLVRRLPGNRFERR